MPTTFSNSEDRLDPRLVDSLSKHLVALMYEFKVGDKSDFDVMSGFVVEVAETWIWVTVGHGISPLFKRHDKGEVIGARILDGFGKEAMTFDCPVAVDSLQLCFFANQNELGADIAFSILPNHLQALIKANGIVPMRYGSWLDQPKTFDHYALIGALPRKKGAGMIVHSCMAKLEKTEDPPSDIKRYIDRFYAKVLADKESLRTIKGMSGGPVLGFDATEMKYYVIACQNEWGERSRVIAALPASRFGPLLETVLTANAELHELRKLVSDEVLAYQQASSDAVLEKIRLAQEKIQAILDRFPLWPKHHNDLWQPRLQ